VKFATVYSIGILVAAFVLSVPTGDTHAQRKPARIETQLRADSTLFSLQLEPGTKPTAGKTFKARIHVKPGNGWHVWSARLSTEGGLVPLTLHIPDELSKYFTIMSIKEIGDAHVGYDSSFEAETIGYTTPFDIIATIKVRDNAAAPLPFSLLVNFQTCNETMCMPPRIYAVPMTILGEKPIDLTITKGKPDTTVRAGGPVIEAGDKSELMRDEKEDGLNRSNPSNQTDRTDPSDRRRGL